jgi:hypothetical protein
LKEYKALLDKYEIDYNPKYLFKDVFKIWEAIKITTLQEERKRQVSLNE